MKVWEYVEYGIYDYDEFCDTKILLTKEKVKENMNYERIYRRIKI